MAPFENVDHFNILLQEMVYNEAGFFSFVSKIEFMWIKRVLCSLSV